MTVESYLHQGRQMAVRWASDPRVRSVGRVAAQAGAGFLLSAAGLGNFPQPIAMALTATLSGWRAAVTALGSAAGYRLFWGASGELGLVWSLLGAFTALLLGKSEIRRKSPLLIPALCCLWSAASGLVWQLLERQIPTLGYLLGVAAGGLSAWLFARLREKKDPVLVWTAQSIVVLALARIAPWPWLNLGCIAAGALALTEAFPAAALSGLALDLAGVSPVSMSAVVCLIWLTRLIPGIPGWGRLLLPGPVFLLVMALTGQGDLMPLAGILLSGPVSLLLPQRPELIHRRGETGLAQVRLELMAGILTQTRQLVLEVTDPPIDEQAVLDRARERSCGGCPNRKSCGVLGGIPRELLHRPWTENASLPFPCRKPGRMILELRRAQEQYRSLRADRDRRREYRQAVLQQYGFLSDYLRDLADQLPRRGTGDPIRFRPQTGVATRSREADNGDKLVQFQGPGGQYFLLLCDGMGTGMGAAQEAATAAQLLHRMLSAGFPGEYALQSLNSLLSLRGRAGAVTVDLVQIHLDTGRTVLYKWGAAPSYLLRGNTPEKIGTAGPPPGIGVSDIRETVLRLSLRRGETLIIASDGVDGEELRRCAVVAPGLTAGEMAAKLLEVGAADSTDDATVAVVRLHPSALST